MGLEEIRHQVTKLCWRLLAGKVEVRESNHFSEFNGHATAYDAEKPESSDARLGETSEILGEVVAACATTQRRVDIASKEGSSVSNVVSGVLGRNSNAAISNVLVLGTAGSPPMKRIEIRLADPTEVPGTLNRLAVAFQTTGADLDTMRHPGMPANEIWLTSALHDEKKTLLSCAARVGAPVTQRVVAKPGSPQT